MELRSCYERVFVRGCGEVGGLVIGGLMTRAFQDPFYLRYQHKPDCDLHSPSSSTSSTSVATMAGTQGTQPKVTTNKPRHKTERSRPHKDKHREVDPNRRVSHKEDRSSSTRSAAAFVYSGPCWHLTVTLMSVLIVFKT